MIAKLSWLIIALFSLSLINSTSEAIELPGFQTIIVPLLVIAVLIVLNGFFVLAEIAIVGVRPTQMEHLANTGNPLAEKILAILRSNDLKNRYIATAQLGITIASLGLGMYGEPAIATFIEAYLAWLFNLDLHAPLVITIGSITAVALLTYLHIVLGEMIPKSLALAAPDRASSSVYRPMRFVQTIFTVPVIILNGIGDALLRLFRIPLAEEELANLRSPDELERIVSYSVAGGLLTENEEEIIRNIFNFSERQVHQVMTPRPKIEAIPHDISLPDLLKQVAESNHSRFPVYEGELDHIIGHLHIKDLVCHQLRLKGKFDLRLLLRPMPVVPEHYPVEKLLNTFKRQRVHLAVVLDEFGGTAGIATLEDLLEEVVGEVLDEFDLEKEPIIEQEPGIFEVAGDYLIEDLGEDIDLGDEADLPDVETVGGLIMAQLGRVPQAGDEVTYNQNVQFTVLAVDGLAVSRARVEYSSPQEERSDEG
jgi:CBS domain containing-hemolysin-like protein